MLQDEEMNGARLDKISVEPGALYDESLSAISMLDNHRKIYMYTVSGCTFNVINGRYLACGTQTGAKKYINVRGWVLCRLYLTEIPEMGIFVESCYDMNAGPSLSAINDARAVIAEEQLRLSENETGIHEGTSMFGRNFTQIIRVGNRMKITDQTLQMVRFNKILRDL